MMRPIYETKERDKVNLDIFWLKDDSLEDSANLPATRLIAADLTTDESSERS